MYDDLIKKSEEEGIEVIEMKFKGKLKGLYSSNVIALNSNIETATEKNCILAEELGHHYTSIGNILDNKNVENAKQEKRARNWAYENLISLNDLIKAYKAGAKNRNEISDFLNVTEDFFENAIKHYKEKYGIFYRIDNYFIYFEPLGIMEMFETK